MIKHISHNISAPCLAGPVATNVAIHTKYVKDNSVTRNNWKRRLLNLAVFVLWRKWKVYFTWITCYLSWSSPSCSKPWWYWEGNFLTWGCYCQCEAYTYSSLQAYFKLTKQNCRNFSWMILNGKCYHGNQMWCKRMKSEMIRPVSQPASQTLLSQRSNDG